MPRLLVALVPVALFGLSASAFHEDDLPLVLVGATESGEWASYRLQVAGPELAVDLEGVNVTHPVHLGIMIYDADVSLVAGGQVGSNDLVMSGPDSAAAKPPVCFPIGSATFCQSFGVHVARLGVTVHDVEAGTYYVLVWANGPGAWAHAVRGAGGAVLAQDGGRNGFLYRAADFPAALAIDARAGAHSPPLPP